MELEKINRIIKEAEFETSKARLALRQTGEAEGIESIEYSKAWTNILILRARRLKLLNAERLVIRQGKEYEDSAILLIA